jgi:hypothetical protein
VRQPRAQAPPPAERCYGCGPAIREGDVCRRIVRVSSSYSSGSISAGGVPDVRRQVGGSVLTGRTKTYWAKRPKARHYFLPCQGVTLSCRTGPDQSPDIPGAAEVPALQFAPLAQYVGT